jgi:hypothetical protein
MSSSRSRFARSQTALPTSERLGDRQAHGCDRSPSAVPIRGRHRRAAASLPGPSAATCCGVSILIFSWLQPVRRGAPLLPPDVLRRSRRVR